MRPKLALPLLLLLILPAGAALFLLWNGGRGRRESAPATAAARISVDEVQELLRAREERVGDEAPLVGADRRPASSEEPKVDGAVTVVDAGAVDAGAAKDALTIGARLLDELAHAVSGGTLAWLEADADGMPAERRSASSEASGAVWLVLPRAELPAQGPLFLAAGGQGRMRIFQPVERVRWENVSLLSLAEITLRSGGEVAGRVLDERGLPVEGAYVGLTRELGEATPEQREMARIWPFWEDLGLGNAPPITRTDRDGRYRIVGAPTGRFAAQALLRARGPAPLLPDREEGVEVRPGAETRVRDLVLREPAPEELLRGRVLDPEGGPVAGAQLSLLDAGGNVRYPARAESDEDGRFALPGVAGASYRLSASDPARRWRGVELPDVSPGQGELELRFGEPLPPPAADPRTAAMPPEVERDEAAAGARAAIASASLHGRFTLGGEPAMSWDVRGAAGHTRLDSRGEFTLTGLPAGPTTLTFSTAPARAVTRCFEVPLELVAGPNEWSLDVPVAALVLEHLPPAEAAAKDGTDWFEYVLAGEGPGYGWQLFFQETEGRRIELRDVPAGQLELRYRGPGAALDSISRWPVALGFELLAGTHPSVSVP